MTAGEDITAGECLCVKTADGKAYLADANDTTLLNFIGFAQNSVSAASAVTISTAGVNDQVSGLTKGEVYFMSDTPGAISATPGTYTIEVGRALSADEILITPMNVEAIDDKIKEFMHTGTAGETLATGDVVYLKASDGKLWKADADADESAYNTVGTILIGGDADATVQYIRDGGVVTTSGLTAGDIHYLSSTAGDTSTTPHANRPLPIGLALSATQMLLGTNPSAMKMNIQTHNITWGTEGDIAVTCGFKAQMVICVSTSASAPVGGLGVAIGTTSMCTWAYNNSPYTAHNHTGVAAFGNDGTDYTYYTLGSITDTGYTLTDTDQGSGAAGGVAGTLTLISIGF
jgi:hypothetical protein